MLAQITTNINQTKTIQDQTTRSEKRIQQKNLLYINNNKKKIKFIARSTYSIKIISNFIFP